MFWIMCYIGYSLDLCFDFIKLRKFNQRWYSRRKLFQDGGLSLTGLTRRADIKGDSFRSVMIVDACEVSTREGVMEETCFKMATYHGLSLFWLTKRVDIKGPLLLDQ